MKKVVALGELLIDFTCLSIDQNGYPTMAAHPGGAPANFLAALSKFGVKTGFIGKVGRDAFGNMLKSTLEKAGIQTKGLIQDADSFTTLAFVTLDQTGNREFSFSRKPGADTRLTFEEINKELLDDADVFHFGSLSLTDEPAETATRKAVAYAKSEGKWITYDPNLRKPLWKDLELAREKILWGLQQADVVKISDEEVDFLFHMKPREGAEYILNHFGVKLVFVTCGAEGCYSANPLHGGQIQGLKGLTVVDTTGAGDIFGGSALYRLLETETKPELLDWKQIQDITQFACTSAGLSTAKFGGMSSVPEKTAVLEEMMRSYG